MSTRLSELRIERLVVLLLILFIPGYFIYFTWKWEADISKTLDIIFFYFQFINIHISEPVKWAIIWIGIPLFFSAPWEFFLIFRATRVANALLLVGRALGRVRIDQKIFYGLNAMFVFTFFVLPIASPFIAVLGALAIPYYIFKKIPFLGIIRWILNLFVFVIIILVPFSLSAAFYLSYVKLLTYVWSQWTVRVNLLYGIGLCLADSVAIGNFWLMIKEGAAQVNPNERVPYEQVLLLKIVAFVIFLLIFLNSPGYHSTFINAVTILATILSTTEMVIRFGKGLGKKGESKMGYAMIPVFTVVNFLNRYQNLRTVVIVLAALLFFGLFAISYHYAEDPELFPQYAVDDNDKKEEIDEDL